jgi:outer membrane protein TolC
VDIFKTRTMLRLVIKLKKIVLLLVFFFGLNSASKGQVDSLFLDPKVDIELLLPSLDSLYEIAKLVNPTLKQENAAMRSSLWAERYNRWLWAQNIYVFYNYNFGSLPFFAYTDITNPQGLTQVSQGYRAGVNIQLSIFDVMGHKGRVNEQREKALVSKYKHDAESLELKRKLGSLYADMVGYNRMYKGRNEDLLTQLVACQVAEKEYREGTIHISEYARQKNVMADAEASYHDSFRFYLAAIEQFEAILGVSLESVMKKPKKN